MPTIHLHPRALSLFGFLLVAVPSAARAAPYSVEIVIEDEADINQLYYEGEISEEERETLLTLFATKLDLNLATRDELYDLPGFTYELADAVIAAREKKGRFHSPSDLAGVEGMTPDIYNQAAAFITASKLTQEEKPWTGEVRLGAIWRSHEDDPGAHLRTRFTFLGYGGAGLLLLVRPQIGLVNDATPGWACTSSESCKYGTTLSASATTERLDPAGAYVFWNGPRFSGIVGSYLLGYGLGVTLDNSRRKLPNGWYPNLDIIEDVDSGKVRSYEGFLGLAARYKQIDLGPGHLEASLFGSFAYHDMYFSDIFYTREDGVTAIVDEEESVHPQKGRVRYSLSNQYPTYPWFMRELLGGGNVSYFWNRRSHVGVTGYGANWHMEAEAENIRPSSASPYPDGRSTWGVVGVNTRFGWGRYDLAGEIAVTDQGSPGLLLKGWLSPAEGLQITPSFRYYDWRFDNPYNRGEGSADEFAGNRSRDELGGKLVIEYKPLSLLRLRLDLDVWYHRFPGFRYDQYKYKFHPDIGAMLYDPSDPYMPPEDPATDLELRFRTALAPTSKERFTVYLVFHDEDLSKDGRELTYATPASDAKMYLWGGSKITYAVSATTKRIPRVDITAFYRHSFEDVERLTEEFDQSWYVWLRVAANLTPGPRLTARFKYLDESTVDDPDQKKDDTLLELYVQATQRLPWDVLRGSVLALRFGWTHFTDNRTARTESTYWEPEPHRDEYLVKGYFLAKF